MENQNFKRDPMLKVQLQSDPHGVPQASKVTLKVCESGNDQKWPKMLKNDQRMLQRWLQWLRN